MLSDGGFCQSGRPVQPKMENQFGTLPVLSVLRGCSPGGGWGAPHPLHHDEKFALQWIMMRLWSGRLPGSLNEAAAKLNTSLPFDRRLAIEDINGSIAWARALSKVNLLSKTELEQIIQGLENVRDEFSNGEFVFNEGDEDIHTAVERRLTEKIGQVAGKLHTGRSRNDQVATDFRLWTMNAVNRIIEQIHRLQNTLIERAEADFGVILPGYTHMQQAQPLLLSHWWLSHFWALQRDQKRFMNLLDEVKVLPLGSGALAGTGFPIDRFFLAEELGFDEPAPNSLDAVNDRDFAAVLLFNAAMMGVHISRFAEALIIYSTREFGFIEMADEFSTGSSLMPQKKNPDMLELARGKCGMFIGRLTGLLGTLKALPSAYDKDMQEDKPPVFEVVDTLDLLLPVLNGVIATLVVNPDQMLAAVNKQVLATDLADYLVRRAVPFREAHESVGRAVRKSEELGVELNELDLDEWKSIHQSFDQDLFDVFDLERSVSQKCAWGGTAPDMVKKQIKYAHQVLNGATRVIRSPGSPDIELLI